MPPNLALRACILLDSPAGQLPRYTSPTHMSRHHTFAAIIAASFWMSACARYGTLATAPVPAMAAEACADSAIASWRDSAEAAPLVTARGRVFRSHCRLVFRVVGGDTTVFTDDQSEGDHTVNYTYLGSVGAGFDLVRIGYYEGGTYMLVGATGDLTYVAGPPTFSPDSTRFASLSIDLEAEYEPNVLEIWRLEGHHPRLEIAIKSEEWGPSDPRWFSASRLTFIQNFPTDSLNTYRKLHAQLVRGASGWALSVTR